MTDKLDRDRVCLSVPWIVERRFGYSIVILLSFQRDLEYALEVGWVKNGTFHENYHHSQRE